MVPVVPIDPNPAPYAAKPMNPIETEAISMITAWLPEMQPPRLTGLCERAKHFVYMSKCENN